MDAATSIDLWATIIAAMGFAFALFKSHTSTRTKLATLEERILEQHRLYIAMERRMDSKAEKEDVAEIKTDIREIKMDIKTLIAGK